MNFVFENTSRFSLFDYSEYKNFLNCEDVNSSGIKRFTVSPLISTLLRYKQVNQTFKNYSLDNIQISNDANKFSKYIIATGVTHSPNDWCGNHRKSIFHYLNQTYLRDVRKGKALILLDQSHEGYHEEWMYDELHKQCNEYGINPNQLIYVTGNLEEENQYKKWLLGKNVVGVMCIAPYSHFECMIHETAINRVRIHGQPSLPTFNDHLVYKTNNITNIKTYNCLQKRPRAHRIWMFKELVANNLLEFGINSMNDIDYQHTYYENRMMEVDDFTRMKQYLPMLPPSNKSDEDELTLFSSQDSGSYPEIFNEQILLDTWVSVVSEASFGEDTCFISEKTFKPIAAAHPIIALGNKYTMRNLQDLGYKTFHPYIDETYDSLDTWERLDAIIKEIKRINSMSQVEKLKWFSSMQDILIYNVDVLRKNSIDLVPKAVTDIDTYFKNYNVPKTD